MLLDMTPRNEDLGPNALSVSHDSKRLAFIGPSEYTVCVVDARSLDEVSFDGFAFWLESETKKLNAAIPLQKQPLKVKLLYRR
jgi:hypothetical protein